MTHNDILRRLRYALDLNDAQSAHLFALGGHACTEDDVRAYLLRQDDEGHLPLDDDAFGAFLDGLIRERRGPPPPGREPPPPVALTNNEILKKLRIALSMKSDDVRRVVAIGGRELGKAELSAFFRPPDHKHFRVCGDQILRAFFRGLTAKLR